MRTGTFPIIFTYTSNFLIGQRCFAKTGSDQLHHFNIANSRVGSEFPVFLFNIFPLLFSHLSCGIKADDLQGHSSFKRPLICYDFAN